MTSKLAFNRENVGNDIRYSVELCIIRHCFFAKYEALLFY